ncbi:hypothetical protein HPB48_006464 [Haemaphysalis longicornis]|uniref:HTH CENPB-type domain-containing protein n=1 Tax=Haemaphysalis longicornis TaxID=44386 RepID=A0A9J6FAP8_HAELO|nr:hypothetical protein HPB48_006464 [Haemaphysalis longicornis]
MRAHYQPSLPFPQEWLPLFAMHSYTVKRQLKVLDWHRKNGRNVHLTYCVFKLDRKKVREWDKKYEVLLQQNFGKSKVRHKLSSGAPIFSEELNDTLYQFFERERNCRCAVSNRLLSEKALNVANKLQLGNFKASSQYLKRWKQRLGVSMRQATNSQKLPEDCADAVRAFHSAAGSLRSCHYYTLHNISNMDQTMVRIGMPTNRTNDLVAASTIRVANTGCTSLLQPADVFWNKPLKACLRRTWEAFMRKGEKTLQGNLRKPSRQDVLDFVAEAWSFVPEKL